MFGDNFQHRISQGNVTFKVRWKFLQQLQTILSKKYRSHRILKIGLHMIKL